MTPARWNETCLYLDETFGMEDDHLQELMPRAISEGVPDIAVSPSVGRLLMMMAKLVGARTIVEVGTLAGYSATWLARGMVSDGMLITIEPNMLHAEVSERGFRECGLGDRTRIMRETGLEALPKLVDELGEGSVDLVFLDALKEEYPAYLPHAKRLLRSGGLLIADNTLGSTEWWITDAPGSSANRDAVECFNAMVAGDGGFEACCVPLREGVLMARRVVD